jgi:hypothetical protein
MEDFFLVISMAACPNPAGDGTDIAIILFRPLNNFQIPIPVFFLDREYLLLTNVLLMGEPSFPIPHTCITGRSRNHEDPRERIEVSQ